MGKFTPKAGFDGKSVNGTVVSSNKNGAILRNRSIPIIKQTNASSTTKNQFSYIAHLWSNLSSTIQNRFITDSVFGITGYYLFQYMSQNLAIFGLDPIYFVPSEGADTTWTGEMIIVSTTLPACRVTTDANHPLYKILIECTGMLSAGITTPKESDYRIITSTDIDMDKDVAFEPQYNAVFPPLAIGSGLKVFMRCTSFKYAQGVRYSSQVSSVVL